MTDDTIEGGCLCGAVRYEVRKPFLRFAHCHCSRCRQATGSSHATNLYVLLEQLRWLRGEEQVRRYDLPTAKSFSTTFCTKCGAPLPHHTRSRTEWVVPAGSVDGDPGLTPQTNIFWGSRPPWSCADVDLPKHDEMSDGWRAGEPGV